MATKAAVKKTVKTSKATSEKSLDERILEWGLLLDCLKHQADGDIYPSTFCIGTELALRNGSNTLADVYEGLAEAMEVAEDLIGMFGEDTTIDDLAKKGKRRTDHENHSQTFPCFQTTTKGTRQHDDNKEPTTSGEEDRSETTC